MVPVPVPGAAGTATCEVATDATTLLKYMLFLTANLPTNIVDLRGFDSSIILIKGVEFPGLRGFPEKSESSNVSGDNVSREIGAYLRSSHRRYNPPEIHCCLFIVQLPKANQRIVLNNMCIYVYIYTYIYIYITYIYIYINYQVRATARARQNSQRRVCSPSGL